ncbi:MAG: major capsid protein [Microviridae sp.]|nr:MAG: major capsid protein [Microviridae sp.]
MAEKYFNQPSVMTAQQHFSGAPQSDIQRSRFDRSHAYKTTFDAGYIFPFMCDEVLPGDTFNLGVTSFARLATPLKPFMDNVYLDIQFFFVPNRLVWDNWQQFMGERLNPDDDPLVFTMPQATVDTSVADGATLPEYFGIPPMVGTVQVQALPFRAYCLIWNEWYRDQNLQDRIFISTGDGPDTWTGSQPLARGKRHDYFTSCLPWPQKGSAVTIPIGVSAPVLTSNTDTVTGVQAAMGFNTVGGGNPAAGSLNVAADGFAYQAVPAGTFGNSVYPSNLYADLTAATSISINDLRTAFQIQRLLERDARGGTRYIELILSHFGVRSPDARLQRPEFLGGGTTRVNINPVAATAPLPDAPQGNLAAYGTAAIRAGFSKSFTEHGFIIGLASARADLTYQQGIERFWFRQTRFDHYWPAFAHLGEQAVLNREIYAQGTGADTDVFGYQERFAEYRYKPSRITGLFNSGHAESLDVWHLSQDFGSLPLLNDAFIRDNPPIDRVIAVTTEPHFLADFWIQMKCDRPMPIYSIPGFIDHY